MVWTMSLRVAGGLLAVSREDGAGGFTLSGLRVANSGGDQGRDPHPRGTGDHRGLCGCALLAMV